MRPFPRRAALATTALLLLSGCNPVKVDELRGLPPALTWHVALPFDTMAGCIASRAVGDYEVTPIIFPPRDGLAYVTLAFRGVDGLFAEFTIRKEGDGSLIEYHRRDLVADLGGSDDKARGYVEACSKR